MKGRDVLCPEYWPLTIKDTRLQAGHSSEVHLDTQYHVIVQHIHHQRLSLSL